MPVIGGRYYMNPAQGARLEQARAEEEGRAGKGRVHHVQIECADGGYVARVHRHPAGVARDEQGRFEPYTATTGKAASENGQPVPPQPTTHVFTSHNDLVDFLREELAPGEK